MFGALGAAKLEKSMPEIIERSIQPDLSPYVRDGYIMMFIYLPLTFGKEFTPYIGQIIQPILKALADDCEFVRDTAIKVKLFYFYFRFFVCLLTRYRVFQKTSYYFEY